MLKNVTTCRLLSEYTVGIMFLPAIHLLQQWKGHCTSYCKLVLGFSLTSWFVMELPAGSFYFKSSRHTVSVGTVLTNKS